MFWKGGENPKILSKNIQILKHQGIWESFPPCSWRSRRRREHFGGILARVELCPLVRGIRRTGVGALRYPLILNSNRLTAACASWVDKFPRFVAETVRALWIRERLSSFRDRKVKKRRFWEILKSLQNFNSLRFSDRPRLSPGGKHDAEHEINFHRPYHNGTLEPVSTIRHPCDV